MFCMAREGTVPRLDQRHVTRSLWAAGGKPADLRHATNRPGLTNYEHLRRDASRLREAKESSRRVPRRSLGPTELWSEKIALRAGQLPRKLRGKSGSRPNTMRCRLETAPSRSFFMSTFISLFGGLLVFVVLAYIMAAKAK